MPNGSAKKLVSENPFANTKLIIAISFTKIFKLGPLVSFNGSPIVSPITAAVCAGVPLPNNFITTLPSAPLTSLPSPS